MQCEFNFPAFAAVRCVALAVGGVRRRLVARKRIDHGRDPPPQSFIKLRQGQYVLVRSGDEPAG